MNEVERYQQLIAAEVRRQGIEETRMLAHFIAAVGRGYADTWDGKGERFLIARVVREARAAELALYRESRSW